MEKLLAGAMIAVASVGGATAQSSSLPHGVLSAPGGRYVFGQVSEYAKHQYMLDTLTGQLWQIGCVVEDKASKKEDCQYMRLDSVYYDDLGSVLPDAARSRAKKK